MKHPLVYLAVTLFLISISFTFKITEITWLWAEEPQVALILRVSAAICLGIFFFVKVQRRRLEE